MQGWRVGQGSASEMLMQLEVSQLRPRTVLFKGLWVLSCQSIPGCHCERAVGNGAEKVTCDDGASERALENSTETCHAGACEKSQLLNQSRFVFDTAPASRVLRAIGQPAYSTLPARGKTEACF